MWDGFWAVEVAPSPKFQLHERTEPSVSVLASVKSQVRSVHEGVKLAVGAELPVAGRVTSVEAGALVAPVLSVTTKVTV